MRRHTANLGLIGGLTLLAACGGTGEPSSVEPDPAVASNPNSPSDPMPTEPINASPAMTSESAGLTGTWDYVLDEADREVVLVSFVQEGLIDSADEVVTRIGFDGNDWWQGFLLDGDLFLLDGVPEGDGGSFVLDDDVIVMTGAHGEARITYEWAIDGDSLSLTAVEECAVSGSEMTCTDDQAKMDPVMLLVTDQTFSRSGDDPSY